MFTSGSIRRANSRSKLVGQSIAAVRLNLVMPHPAFGSLPRATTLLSDFCAGRVEIGREVVGTLQRSCALSSHLSLEAAVPSALDAGFA